MALRARLSAPREERNDWPWHNAKWTELSASLLMGGDRRMEAENYLAGGYGIRLAMEARKTGWKQLHRLVDVWQPSRLKGIQVSREFGTPFLAATQVFDLRPVPRKFLSLDRTDNSKERFVTPGMILVTCSGNVGRATLACKPHEGILISHDLLRVEPEQEKLWGWLYAYLRAPQTRAMMSAAQYGHIIKHLEVSHLNALPMPVLRDELLNDFCTKVQTILDARNKAQSLLVEAESRFEKAIGLPDTSNIGESGFSVRANSFFAGRRRLEGFFHNPAVSAIRAHFVRQKLKVTRLAECGFDVWLPNRFKRINAEDGVPLLDSSDLFEVNPDISKRIADGDFGDHNCGRVKAGWLLLARSGQIYGINGSLTLANAAHEGRIISDHIIRIAPNDRCAIKIGYVYIALSHPILGRPLVKALAYGSSIPEIDVADIEQLEVVRLSVVDEEAIADLAEQGAALLAKADLLENDIAAEAEIIIDRFMAGDTRDVVMVPSS